MSILTRAVGHVATAKTFAMAFWPWLLGAFLLGLSAGVYPAFKVTQAFYQRTALKAELRLSAFTAELAKNAAAAEAAIAARQAEASQQLADRDAAITAAVAAIPGKVARQLQPELAAFRSALNADPDLACLRLPLPASAVELLQRPGGPTRAPESD